MSDGKTSSRKKKLIRSRYKSGREDQKDDPGEKDSDSDWGFSEGKKGMAKETKIALSLISVLLVGFGYVVYQQLTNPEGLFSGGDDENKMKVAKVPKNPAEKKTNPNPDGGNQFGIGDNTGGDNSNLFGNGDSNESNIIDQQEPIVPDGDDFFISDNNSLGETETFNRQQPDEFNQSNSLNQTNNGYPYTGGDTTPQFDSSTDIENSRDSDLTSGTQNQYPNFDQGGSQSQYTQSQELDGNGTDLGVGHSQDVEMAGDDFSNTFDNAGDGRDAESNQFSQQTEPEQFKDSGNQQFLNKIPSRQEGNSDQETYGFEDYSTGNTAAQHGQNHSNQLSESSRYSAENNSQAVQSDPNTEDYFGADVAAENRYQPDTETSLAQENRFGQFQEPGFTGEAASAKTTTVRRDEPGEFGSSFDATSRFSGTSIETQSGVYEIQSGDNYWSISKKQYGTARYFLALSRYNRERIPDEKRMRPGMKVLTPSREILEVRYPDLFSKRSVQRSLSKKSESTTTKTSQPSGFHRNRKREPLYRIGEEDTLSGIAQKHLGRSSRWIQIYEMNRSRLPSPNNLTIGTVLQLPADASNVRLVRNLQRDR